MHYKLIRSIGHNIKEGFFGPSGHPELIINHKKKYAYLVNSKAACTSIKQSIIRDLGYNIKDSENPHHYPLNQNERLFVHKNLKDYYIFTVVREPVRRIESLYLNKFKQFETIEKEGFYFQRYMGGIFSLNISFRQFVDTIVDIPDFYSDRHFVSQSYLINKSQKMFCSKVNVFKLECPDTFSILKNEFGLDIISKSNQSNHNYAKDVLEDCRAQLIKRYADDFVKLGYQF